MEGVFLVIFCSFVYLTSVYYQALYWALGIGKKRKEKRKGKEGKERRKGRKKERKRERKEGRKGGRRNERQMEGREGGREGGRKRGNCPFAVYSLVREMCRTNL